MEDKGVLKVYLEDNEFVIERINPFNHSFKHKYITEDGLREGLESYIPIIEQMNIQVQQEVVLNDGGSLLQKTFLILFGDENTK